MGLEVEPVWPKTIFVLQRPVSVRRAPVGVNLVGMTGVEPATSGFGARRSTN